MSTAKALQSCVSARVAMLRDLSAIFSAERDFIGSECDFVSSGSFSIGLSAILCDLGVIL